jgi:hypothetical protein
MHRSRKALDKNCQHGLGSQYLFHQALQVIARPNGRFRYWWIQASRESSFIGDGHTSKLLEFGQLAQGNHTTRTIFVSCYVVIVRAVNKETNSVFVTEANQCPSSEFLGQGAA